MLKLTVKQVIEGSMWWQHKKATINRALGLKNLCIFPEHSAGGLRPRRECCLGYICLWEYIWKANFKIHHSPKTCHKLDCVNCRPDQYNRNNYLEIQGIFSPVGDEVLDDKVIETFESLNMPLAKSDCCRLGKSIPKNTIVTFVKRKNFYAGLRKKLN